MFSAIMRQCKLNEALHLYGIDLDNCALQGEVKQILYKIKITIKEV